MQGEHRVEIFFHCAEHTVVAPIAGGVSLTRGGRAVRLRFPDMPGGTFRVLEGSNAPIGGWISRRFDRKVAAPTLVWSGVLRGTCLLRTTIDC
jgi:hypothetical protein